MSTWPYPFWIAHRGGGDAAPENTLPAFALGAAQGFEMFECDVKLSADEHPFLLHDDTLDRTTSGHGLAGNLSWQQLQQLDAGAWFAPSYQGTRLPDLQAVARFCQTRHLCLNLEIKPTPDWEQRTGQVVAHAAQQLWQNYAGPPPLLSSFQVVALQAAQQAQPELPRALLLEEWQKDSLEVAQSLGCIAIVAHAPLWQTTRLKATHAAGMRACAYTVNDWIEAQQLRLMGLDGLITDKISFKSKN